MNESNNGPDLAKASRSDGLRRFVAVCFRRKRILLASFLGIFSASVLLACLLPTTYVAQMKFLVGPEHNEGTGSAEAGSATRWESTVSEQELRPKIDLIRSREVLSKVVEACNLKTHTRSLWGPIFSGSGDQGTDLAVLNLERHLTAEPIPMTNIIRVTYRSEDPQQAVTVLNTLAHLYQEKQLALYHSAGQFPFLHEQSEIHRQALSDAEDQLRNFGKDEGVVSPALERDVIARKLVESEADYRAARVSIDTGRRRIQAIQEQLSEIAKVDSSQPNNSFASQETRSKLAELEAKRAKLASEKNTSDGSLVDINHQIAELQQAVKATESAERTERGDESTLRELRSELAKDKTELAGSEARASALSSLIASFRAAIGPLEEKELLHQNMLRTAKADEESYLLYLRKEEEARISDELERRRLLSTLVAEPASLLYPPHARSLVILVGLIFAAIGCLLLGLVAERLDPSFRTPAEVESFLGSPVLAAFPKVGE